MGARLEALRALQNIELQIVDIRRQLKHKERIIAAQANKVSAAEAALAAEREQIARSQREFDALDLEVKARSGQVAKLRDHVNSAKTNKEYAGALQQLNNEKADLSKLETRALEHMTRLDEARALAVTHEKGIETERRRLADLRAQLEQTRAAYSNRMTQLEKERAASAERIEPAIVAQFDRLSERYDGEVMAEVAKPNPRRDDYICSGCNMSLTAEIANSLAVRDDVLACRSCGRILYLGK